MTHFHLLKDNGYYSFIIPKSICYSKGWNNTAKILNDFCLKLIDARLAFKNVLLEQIIFLSTKNINIEDSFIKSGYINNHNIIENTYIPRAIFNQYQVLLCGLEKSELNLILKIIQGNKDTYNSIVDISRGLNWQSHSSNNSSYQSIYRGENLYKYRLSETNDFINLDNFDKKSYEYILKPKLLNQLAIAHVKNPYPHFYLQSYIDKKGNLFVYETISCTFPKTNEINLLFLLAFNNSKLFAWILYKFIYSNSIRSTRFDSMYIGKIPIPKLTIQNQKPFIQKAEKMLELNQELYNKSQSVLSYFKVKFEYSNKFSQKIQNFYNLDSANFLKEIIKLNKEKQNKNKKKVTGEISRQFKINNNLKPSEEQEWLEYFEKQKTLLLGIQSEIEKTDSEINQMIYSLYHLTQEEIEIVENVK